jgi:hypothetical protein
MNNIEELIWNFAKDIWESEYGDDVGTYNEPDTESHFYEKFNEYIKLINKLVTTTNEQPRTGKICTGGTFGNNDCPMKGQFVEGCDDGCMYPGA